VSRIRRLLKVTCSPSHPSPIRAPISGPLDASSTGSPLPSSSGGAKLRGFEGLAAGGPEGTASASSHPPKFQGFEGFGGGFAEDSVSESPKLVKEEPTAHGFGFTAGWGLAVSADSSEGAKDDPKDQGFADVAGGGLEISGASASEKDAPKAHGFGLAAVAEGLGVSVSVIADEPKDQGL
jgi:hypothetical protein